LRTATGGVPIQKDPFDLALYSMLLDQARPRTLIEIGSYKGWSVNWFADQVGILGLGMKVLSIDLEVPATVSNPAVAFLQGDARELKGHFAARAHECPSASAHGGGRLESSSGHDCGGAGVFRSWLRSAEYIVIEDGILSDMRVAHLYDGGPLKAIEAFLNQSAGRYEVDRNLCDYFGKNVTWNVNGYLRRV
jgi:cephalosporin hydroxylase